MVEFRGLTKRFPGIIALDDVSFHIAAGSCHAICGENGAGKSTLGRILAGVHQADGGQVVLDGSPVQFTSPRKALEAGVAMVHQELAFCENLTVADNLCLHSLPARRGFIDGPAMHRQAMERLDAVGASIDPDRSMRSLSVAEQQLVQIAVAVSEGARVIIFDEPTSALGEAEARRLYELIARLRERGVTQVYVSHRMPEIFALCDTVTVLRDGRHVATQATSDLTEAELVRQMIGRELSAYLPAHVDRAPGDEALRIGHLSSPGRFHDVSFTVRRGEVLGLAGLVGAGRSEVAQAIFGLDRRATGEVHVHGRRTDIRRPRDAMRLGIGYVPEDRKRQGLVPAMRARENATLPTLRRFARAGWIDRRAEVDAVSTAFTRIAVRGSREAIVSSFSGGNQQKVVLSRWLTADSQILLLDEPTRGVDVGAKAELHAWIDQRASSGAAVVLISSELPELLGLSTRIIVLREGRVAGELARHRVTQDEVLRLMAGLTAA